MEYNYYRELKHNYLVFEKPEGADEKDRYQYRIVESGRIKGLVPCTERSINGQDYIYYEINSMQTLKDRFMVSKMEYSQLNRLITDIKKTLEELSEFLLGEDGVVFNAGAIYTDLATGDYKVLYCPFFDETRDFGYFCMELLELVDEKDEKATQLIYSLCEESSKEGSLTFDLLTKALLEDEEEPAAINDVVRKSITSEPEEDTGYIDYGEFDVSGPDEEDDAPESALKKADKRLGGKVQILMALLFLCVVGAMVYIRKSFILSSQENMLSIVVMLVSVVTGAIAFVGGVRALKPEKNRPEKESEDESSFEKDDAMDFYEEHYQYEEKEDLFEEDTARFKNTIRVTGSFSEKKAEPEYGETVVLDEVMDRGMTLFSRNLDKTVRIALDKLPLTVGKMEGCVDRVLGDKSISRMHCRFTKEGDKIGILDLGSTNGTYRNGVKLRPRELTIIEEGDEIRMGRVCFDCR